MPEIFAPLASFTAHPWAMHPAHLRALCDRITAGAYANRPEISDANTQVVTRQARKATRLGNRAIIPITGVILPEADWLFDLLEIDYTVISEVGDMLASAMSDEGVAEIMLYVSSPGGVSYGIQEAGDKLYAARQVKPVRAHVSELGASAGYWLAAQAEEITANPTAQVGSIGVYTVVVDSSEAADNWGYKVHVVSSGELKGQGEPGAPISEAFLAAEQEVIDGLAAIFVSAVARGRGANRERIDTLATGGVWLAESAKRIGLIDGVMNWEDAQTGGPGAPDDRERRSHSLDERTSQMAKEGEIFDMTPEVFEKKHPDAVKSWKDEAAEAARTEAVDADRQRVQDLQAAFPGREAFVLAQTLAGADVATAKAALVDVLLAENKVLTERLTVVQSGVKPAVAGAGRPAPAAFSDDQIKAEAKVQEGEAPKTYEDACAAYRAVNLKASKREMHSALSEQHPELYSAWLERMRARR